MDERPCVIAAVDFSDISAAVVSSAARTAARLNARCEVVYVIEALSGDEDRGPLLATLRRWVDGVRRESRQALEDLMQPFTEQGAELSGEVLEGKAFAQVIRRAQQCGSALIVLGGPPPARTLGATAERIVRKSPVPVLVIRQAPATGYRNLLVGVDFSEEANSALCQSLDLMEPDGRITVCHVLNTWGLPRGDDEVSRAQEVLEARARTWVDRRAPGSRVEIRVEIGRPAPTLLGMIQSEGIDLLAIGSRGRGRFAHFLLGSVAEAAVRKAQCDVLVASGRDWESPLP